MSLWKNIRLELARTGDFPSGSVSRAYLIRLPLNDRDKIDYEALAGSPHRATIRRHWSNEADESGLLELQGDDFAVRGRSTADRLFKLNGTPLRVGRQVFVMEPDGATLPFRIASIR